MSAPVTFPAPDWSRRTADDWLADVLKEVDVNSGLLADATEEERELAAALLVQRAFVVGRHYPDNMEPLPAMCRAARALVRRSAPAREVGRLLSGPQGEAT